MAVESFLVTALPHSADQNSEFHVSLFVSPRLTPDGSQGNTLAEFSLFNQWPATLGRATIRLLDQRGDEIPTTAITRMSQNNERLWELVFPPTTPVNPWNMADPTGNEWRSFDAKAVHDIALTVHQMSLLSSPLDLPLVRDSPVAKLFLPALGWVDPTQGSLDFDALARNEARLTRELDAMVSGTVTGSTTEVLLGRSDLPTTAQAPLKTLADLHDARRFYDRTEQQVPYQPRPTPGLVRPRPAPIQPDFHQRCTMLGDYPALERLLGLVVDLKIDDLSALANVASISAEITIANFANGVSNPRTECRVAGKGWTATSRDGDWLDGALRVADGERFSVLDLDPDASALKLESFLRSLPRFAWADFNGDPVHAAPPALRATGFAVARAERSQRLREQVGVQKANNTAVQGSDPPTLNIEDISRGIRLEVWDDVSKRWHTLHARLSDVAVDGAGNVLTDLRDDGFLQGAALTKAGDKASDPSYLHQVLAGWEGWSLAAPRPGRTIVHDPAADGGERVTGVAPEPTTVTPVVVTTRSASNTLPRLRFGRHYGLRIWAVDLAGNSTPHDMGTSLGLPGPVAAALDTLAGQLLAARIVAAPATADALRAALQPAAAGPTATPFFGLAVDAAAASPTATATSVAAAADTAQTADLNLAAPVILGDPELDRFIVSRLTPDPAVAPTRAAAISSAFAAVAADQAAMVVDPSVHTESLVLSAVLAAAGGSALSADPAQLAIQVGPLSQTVTVPRPFLRWNPVASPVVIPRFAYTDGESLRRLVIRSGVTLSAPADSGGTIMITNPTAYAGAANAAHPTLGYRDTGERHLAPPKTSQVEAELDGRFDAAIGSTDDAVARRALGIALRESGTLLDITVADIDNPGQRLSQPNVALLAMPDADPTHFVTLADIAQKRGTMLEPGQYVVHSGPTLVVPYLPDSMAAGISLVFPDAGHDRPLPPPFGTEGVNVAFPGSWPTLTPIRLVLTDGSQLSAQVVGSELHIAIPPGEQLRFRLASSLSAESLEKFGLWKNLPPQAQDNPDALQAALDGWFWWLTPGEEIDLIHAVQRPVEIPRPTVLRVVRNPGDTAIILSGAVDVHGPSTERLDVEASWSEQVDDITVNGPETVLRRAAACHTTVRRDEDFVVLGATDGDLAWAATVVHRHKAVHQVGDTRHRMIDYRMRATTRYREYFNPAVAPTADDFSVVGPTRALSVPSTARPGRPVVRSVLPLFRWEETTEPGQPFGVRRRRRAGLRIYLERPWFSSGDGELLGVVLATGDDDGLTGSVSAWASDPVWMQGGPSNRAALPLTDLLHMTGFDDEIEPGRPVAPPAFLPLVDLPSQPAAMVLGYQPEYSLDRQLWFVDMAFDPGAAFWPFVRLAVARYQPDSLAGMYLSPVVLCDFAQLAPERTATVNRPDDHRVRIVLSGPFGVLAPVEMDVSNPDAIPVWVEQSRTVVARLQQLDPTIGTDLGWVTRRSTEMAIQGFDDQTVAWEATLTLPVPIPAARPTNNPEWRVVIEEYEKLPADRSGNVLIDRQLRLVYADQIPL